MFITSNLKHYKSLTLSERKYTQFSFDGFEKSLANQFCQIFTYLTRMLYS